MTTGISALHLPGVQNTKTNDAFVTDTSSTRRWTSVPVTNSKNDSFPWCSSGIGPIFSATISAILNRTSGVVGSANPKIVLQMTESLVYVAACLLTSFATSGSKKCLNFEKTLIWGRNAWFSCPVAHRLLEMKNIVELFSLLISSQCHLVIFNITVQKRKRRNNVVQWRYKFLRNFLGFL